MAENTPSLKETCKKPVESLYMDDSTINEDDESSAIETYHKDPQIFKAGGFETVKWDSNSPTLISKILEEDLAETEVGPSGIINEPQKILGIPYFPKEDAFSFHNYHKLSTNVVDKKMKLTSC